MERSVLYGISAFRWLTLAWMSTVLFFDRGSLGQPWLAYGLVALAVVVTTQLTLGLRRHPDRLLKWPAVLLELASGCALFAAGGAAYAHGGAFAASQSLGVAWPLAGVLTAAVTWGPLAGAVAGLAIGLARLGGELVNGVNLSALLRGRELVGTLTPVVLFSIGGATVGYLALLLRRAERTVAEAKAREEVARTLHDGVLQTLAIVERRTGDEGLALMAREQARELRSLLAGKTGTVAAEASEDLLGRLRVEAARFEQRFGGRAEVVCAGGSPRVPPAVVAALAGAAGEALTNAGRHGGATRVTVYVEPDPDTPAGERRAKVFCSIKDNGEGFDPRVKEEGMGLTVSVRGRLAEVGGRVELVAVPGGGAEVRLWA